MTIKLHRDFRAEVAKLKADGASDQKIHDTMSLWMDRNGVPMMVAEEYRDEPPIVALFAERGVYLMSPEQKARLDAGTASLDDVLRELKGGTS